jgi:Fe2+ or Zn2+ uptake regulation protein
MSTLREISIFCDKCGRWERFQTNLIRIVENRVKSAGWERRKTKVGVRHICKQCVESRNTEEVEFEIWE